MVSNLPELLLNTLFRNLKRVKHDYPDLLKKLTLLPAHETKIIQKEASPNYIKKIFRKSSNNQIIYNVSIWTPIHIQGSQEPIGSYQNGKFEPKIFILEAETTMTKQ